MKRQLSLVLALVMILGSFTSVFAAMPETAVDKAAFLAEEGILKGNLEGELNLTQDLKRRDALVVLSRLFGVEDEAKAYPSEDLPFTDITDEYYAGFIAWAVEEGYTDGKTETIYDLNGPLTAQQFATFLLRALGYQENGTNIFKEAYKTATDLGILEGVEVEEKDTVKRSDMAAMTFNALGVVVKGGTKTLAETLGIEMPAPDKPTDLKVEKVYTDNLAEVRVKLSNVELVKTEDALYNPANYRLAGVDTETKVRHVHLDGDEVVLTLVPYGKTAEQPEFEVLRKGKLFNLTIRNIHRDINKSYNSNTPVDNSIPTIENVDFMGDYGIKVTTSEPIKNPLERNFRLDSRTAMIVEQYGRDIILTPYHGKAFDKDDTELTVDLLDDFAGYRTVKTTEKMELSTDEDLPKVEKTYRSGNKLVVEFDRDVYHDSVEAYETRRDLGNVSFIEKRAPFYAKEAVKVDTNVVEYTFEREIPKGMEITVEGVKNHFNKTMEKDVRVPEEYKDDIAPVVISTSHNVAITSAEDARLVAGLTGTDKEQAEQLKKRLDDGFEATTGKTTILFDKDIAEFAEHIRYEENSSKGRKINVYDFFTLYELDITKRGENAAKDVVIKDVKVLRDRIELSYEKIKVNNKDRDFDYILEVRNLSDLTGNRMDREYLDFQVRRPGTAFNVEIKEIRNRNDANFFNRDGVEIVLEFNNYVNKEEASNAKNYYLDSKLDVDEAIVERDGKTVSLVIYDVKNKAGLLASYDVLEISPRVEALDFPYPSVADRFFELATGNAIKDPAAVKGARIAAERALAALPELDDITLANRKTVEDARKAVNKAIELDKNVTFENIAKLVAAEAKIAELDLVVDNEAKAKEVEESIKALPEPYKVTLEDEVAINAAKKAYDELGALKELVSTDAVDKLNAVVAKLAELKGIDKTALNAALEAADAIVEEDYTAESYAAFEAALVTAKEMPATTQEEVDAKVAAVNAAIEGLVPVGPVVYKVSAIEGYKIVELLGKSTISLPLEGLQAKIDTVTSESIVIVKLADDTEITLTWDAANNVFKSNQRDEAKEALEVAEIIVR